MILGIDLGSSSFKTAVYDRTLRLLGEGSAPCGTDSASGSLFEIPVREAEEAFRSAIAQSLRGSGISADELDAVALSSQAQTFTVRAPDGSARIPFISWRDTRPEEDNPASALSGFQDHSSLYECHPMLTVSKLAYLRKQSSGGLVKTGDTVLMLPTWFVLELAGLAVVDDNIAGMSGLYSLRNGDWWDEALSICGIERSNLPAAADLGSVAGLTCGTAGRFGLAPGIPLILAGNDQTAGAFGAGIHTSDSVLLSLGTAQVAYTICGTLPEPLPGVMRGSYPGGLFHRLTADEYGSGTVSWACSVLPGLTDASSFDHAAAEAQDDCGGVRFIADRPGGTGRWNGADEYTSVSDKAGAVLVCLTDRMMEMLDRFGPGMLEKRMTAAGGGTNSMPWIEHLERRLGKTLEKTDSASPAFGAARMAADTLGL